MAESNTTGLRYRVVSARSSDGPYMRETCVRLSRVVTVDWDDGVGRPVWVSAPIEVKLRGAMSPEDFWEPDAEFEIKIRKISR